MYENQPAKNSELFWAVAIAAAFLAIGSFFAEAVEV